MSWIKFEEIGKSTSGVTVVWGIFTKETRDYIGSISWYGPWRKYCFYPNPQTIWEQDCLRDIANFCEARTKEHRTLKKEPP